jgi:sugar phosphate permease
VLIALLTPAGRIADAVGRKLVYGYGFVVFTAGSAACAFAPSLGVLVGCRVVQAVGAAMLQANSVALVTTSVPQHRMRLGLSIQAAAQAIGLGLGPTLGGLLTQTAGWRAVYWINVPVGCLAIVAGRYLLPRTRHRSPAGTFDLAGAALLALASIALLGALSVAGGLRAPAWLAPLAAVVALAAASAFVVRQRRARFPLVPPALRSRRIALGLAGACLGYLVLFGPLVLVPQLLVGHGGALHIGLILSALPAGFGVAALTAEAIFPASLRNRTRGVIGASACAVVLVMLVLMSSSSVGIVVLLGLAGLCLGVFVPANNALIMRTGPASTAGTLGGLVNMARGIGTTLGIALVTVALHLGGHSAGGPPDGTLAIVLLAAAVASAAVIAASIRPLPGAAASGVPAGQATAENPGAFA